MKEHLFNRIDIIVAPLVFILITLWVYRIKKKQPIELQKYFLIAFFLRPFGVLMISLITEFYYTYGDTYHFYHNAQALRQLFVKEPMAWLKVLFSDPNSGSESMNKYLDIIGNYSYYSTSIFKTSENASLSKIASVFNIICFDSYIGIALFIGLLSFLGCWYIFKTFIYFYPGYEKQFALFCLYLPSLWFWGSGILKDPVCLFALGILCYNVFVKRKGFVSRIIICSIGAFLLIQIKSYIFYAFAMAAIIGWSLYYFNRMSFLSKIITIVIFLGLTAASYSQINDAITEIVDNTIKDSQKWIESYSKMSQLGDATTIPTLDPTPIGFLKFSLEGLITVYMKPFPWQLNKPIYLFVMIENLLIYYIIFKKVKPGGNKFKKNYKLVNNFSFAFFLILGVIVGTNSFNLGTISRYRVPALPFFFAGIFAWKLSKRKNRIEEKSASETFIITDSFTASVSLNKN